MLRERRLDLPEGVSLERESASGISLMDTLRGLRPHRAARRQRPREDGTPAGSLRVLYWRFLALAEARGAGWRPEPETPAEHHSRITSAMPIWADAAPIVRAFEDLRYAKGSAPDVCSARAATARSRLDHARPSLLRAYASSRAPSP